MVSRSSKIRARSFPSLIWGLFIFILLQCAPTGAQAIIAGRDVPDALHIVMWKYHLVGQEDYYRALADSYEKANPGHHVVIYLEDWSRAHSELASWIAGRAGPDLTAVPDVWLVEFVSGLVPYPEQMPAAFLRDFNDVMLKRSRLNGRNLGLVWAASTKALFYRKDLFEQADLAPPTSW